jgi:hypothetical protein
MGLDLVVVIVCTLAFACWVTMHVVIAIGLARRTPRWRALVGLVCVPLAPYWAWQEHMRKRAWLWGIGCAVYVVALALAMRR